MMLRSVMTAEARERREWRESWMGASALLLAAPDLLPAAWARSPLAETRHLGCWCIADAGDSTRPRSLPPTSSRKPRTLPPAAGRA